MVYHAFSAQYFFLFCLNADLSLFAGVYNQVALFYAVFSNKKNYFCSFSILYRSVFAN